MLIKGLTRDSWSDVSDLDILSVNNFTLPVSPQNMQTITFQSINNMFVINGKILWRLKCGEKIKRRLKISFSKKVPWFPFLGLKKVKSNIYRTVIITKLMSTEVGDCIELFYLDGKGWLPKTILGKFKYED